MNRAERRRHARQNKYRIRVGRGIPQTIAGMRQATQCPDCNSNVTIIEIQPGIYRGQVAHDDSCPWYAELKRDLS